MFKPQVKRSSILILLEISRSKFMIQLFLGFDSRYVAQPVNDFLFLGRRRCDQLETPSQ